MKFQAKAVQRRASIDKRPLQNRDRLELDLAAFVERDLSWDRWISERHEQLTNAVPSFRRSTTGRLRHEGRPDGRLDELLEFVVNEPEHQAAFPDARFTEQHNLHIACGHPE